MSFIQLRSPRFNNPLATPSIVSATITGTATASITESDIVTGGKTIIITITNETFVASGAAFDSVRQDIINGLDSAQSEGTGWDAVVKAGQSLGGVVRTSATVVTVTLDAFASYDISSQETITVTLPSSVFEHSGTPVVGSPTFTVATVGGGGSSIKTWNGLAVASHKTHNGLAVASRKKINGLA